MSAPTSSPLPSVNRPDRGESTDVIELHAAIVRERPEPIEGTEPLNLWIVVFIAVLLFWAGSYLTKYSGGFRGNEFSENQINLRPPPSTGGGGAEDPAMKVAREGAIVFNSQCSPCHQADGNGLPNQFPPLAGSEWVLAEGPNRIIRIVLNGAQGPIKVKGMDFNGAMNAFKDGLDDKQIAAVLTYVRNSWGNKASLVKPEEVAAIRKELAAVTALMNPADLEKLPVTVGGGGAAPAELTPDQLKEALKKLPPDQLKALILELSK
jgi:mono/diheme cytochrome c family protein